MRCGIGSDIHDACLQSLSRSVKGRRRASPTGAAVTRRCGQICQMHLVGADCRCCASSGRQHQLRSGRGRAPPPLSLLPPSSPAQDKADSTPQLIRGSLHGEEEMPGGRQHIDRQSISDNPSREAAMPCSENRLPGRPLVHACLNPETCLAGPSPGAGPGLSTPESEMWQPPSSIGPQSLRRWPR